MFRVSLTEVGTDLMNARVDVTQVLLNSLLPTGGIVSLQSCDQLRQLEFIRKDSASHWLIIVGSGLNYPSGNRLDELRGEARCWPLRLHSTILR